MEINSATVLPPTRPGVDFYHNLIARLSGLDSVEAEVLRSSPGWMVLRTPLGKLLTANSLPLRDGDRVRLRVEHHGGQPLLKLAPIARRPLAPLALDAAVYPRLASAARAGAGPLLGVIERVGAQGVSARFPAGNEALPPIAGARGGDWLLLHRRASGNRIEIFPVEREAVNRALLRRLLPELQAAPGNNLPRLAKMLLRGMTALVNTPTPPGTPTPPPAGATPAAQSVSIDGASPTAPRAVADAGPTGAPSGAGANLQQLLDQLPRLADIDARAIRKWFEFLQLARPTGANADQAASTNLPAVLHRLLNTDRLGNELQAAVQARGSLPAGEPGELPGLRDAIMQLARDVARLAEQGLAQNLGGRASASLQQDAQQPFALSLTVPLVDRDDVQPLRIDLSQRGQGDAKTATGWEIRLDFDFDGLGPIACHGVLNDLEVCASFYSARATTRDQIDAALPDLARQLRRAGFATGEFHSFVGAPASVESAPTTAPAGLIDLRA